MSGYNAVLARNTEKAPKAIGPYSHTVAFSHYNNLSAQLPLDPETGELVGFEPKLASSIKSRSKVFGPGDILFGRLRPELNKVYLVDGEPSEGVCSGEFIVLVPITSQVSARYIRHIIASPFVSRFVEKFRVGASLPRMAANDLLGIRVPVPPLEVQEQIALKLAEMDQELRNLRRRVEELPGQQRETLMEAVGGR